MSKRKTNKTTHSGTRQRGGHRGETKAASGAARLSAARPLVVVGGILVTLVLLVVLFMNTMGDAGENGAQSTATGVGTSPSTERMQLPFAPVEFDPPQVDFGDVPPHTEHHQTVQVRNRSNQTLEVLNVNSSCPCTTIRLEAATIPPGGVVPFELVMDSEGNPGPRTVHGRITFRGYETARVPVTVNVLDG